MAEHPSSASDAQEPTGIVSAGIAKALAGLAALAVAMGIGRFAFTPVLPMMLQDASLSISSGGLLASANYLGYLLGALSAIAVRIRPERAIRGGLLVIGAVTLAMAWPLPFAVWALLRLLAGVASAWVLISVSAWCMESLAGYRRPFLNSLVFAGVGTGIASAGLVCIALIDGNASSAHAWSALGALSFIVTAMIWRFFPSAASSAGTAKATAAPQRYRWDARSVRLVLCYGVFGFGYIIPATFLPVMARNALQGSPLFGWSWPVFGLAAALSTLATAALVRRMDNIGVWIASHIVMAVGVVLPVIWPGLAAIFAAALCVGGTFMVITLVALQEAKRVAGASGTVLIAAMTSAFAAGQIIGPLTVSAGTGSNGGFSLALVIAAVLLAGSAALLAAGRNMEGKGAVT
ncbi:MAG TPA: YbfB/YjiJ family MFS transporter [Noviherbaspirillum sp.]|uniref:YbfB/YjiJ family MFS transporter n=1 Tax=Noviherbaspirillum sp. TaxID=1926288 RepID=UPI002D6841EB|nr:YbfB/YjiJ family MFS transporter [Noviherbaspirillum sp.]HYD94814.1 YbfB/YjiJ family MFS transporter [Noviherbaspirillum sp.]